MPRKEELDLNRDLAEVAVIRVILQTILATNLAGTSNMGAAWENLRASVLGNLEKTPAPSRDQERTKKFRVHQAELFFSELGQALGLGDNKPRPGESS